MKKIVLGLFVIVAMIGMISCESSSNPIAPGSNFDNSMAKGNPNAGETAYTCSGVGEFAGYTESGDPDYAIYEYTLWAGQHNDAGTVVITNDDENIYVTYNTNETADLGEVHVYIWEDASLIPTKRPAPGHADYVVENINADSYTVVIPADLSCGNTYFISTHAALVGNGTEGDEAGSGDNAGETAYAGDASSPDCFDATKGAWWGYATYTIDCFYDISGSVYEDANNSSDLEAGEAGLGDLVVNLLDAAGNVIASTTTNADGSYLFEHVAGGADYTVVVAAGPEGDYMTTENAGGFSITGLSADTADVDFGYVPLFDLSGTVYDDANSNSDDDGEAGLEGVLVTLLDGSGNVVAETYTDANGDYMFENVVGGGDYQIVVGDLAGMDATENDGGFIIVGLGSDTSDIDFGYNTPDDNNGSDGDGAGSGVDDEEVLVGNCVVEYTLWAGQHNNAGSVTISTDNDYLYVTYNTNETADLGTLHIDIRSSAPDERGAPGQYVYNSDQDASFSSGSDSYRVILPLTDLGLSCDDEFYVMAHAALIGDGVGGGDDNSGETAYSGPGSDGSSSAGETAFGGWFLSSGPGSGGSWFYYMTASVCCDPM